MGIPYYFASLLKSHKGIIQAVPGSGKTVLAIKSFCDELEKSEKLRVLIVCPRLVMAAWPHGHG